jgi:DNA-binding MarR family transcriptional regulator
MRIPQASTPEQIIDEVAATCPGGALNAAGVPRLPEVEQAAWIGFLATHAAIMRALEAGLNAEFDLSVSALEVLAKLAQEPGGQVRMSELAHGALLSQSRVSRIVDALELRGLVARTDCPSDSRGVFALVTPAGRELATRALQSHWAQVRELFFDPLGDDQVAELGGTWRAILDGLQPSS